MAESEAWKRQKGEGSKAYWAFLRYRDLGPGRSVAKAVGARQAAKQGKARYFHWWRRWAAKWHWRERAQAWDDHVHELDESRRLDRELEARRAEAEENERQRTLRREEARAARAVGRRIVLRILQGVEGGQLEEMSVPDLLPHLQKASTLLEVGQKLERLELGEVTDRTEQRADPKVRKLANRLEDLLAAAAQGLNVAELEAVLDSLGNGGPKPEG